MGRTARARQTTAGATLALVPALAPAATAVARNLDARDGLTALRLVPAAHAELEVLTRQAVAQARQDGATWQDVADTFGVTRQAASQRYGPASCTCGQSPCARFKGLRGACPGPA